MANVLVLAVHPDDETLGCGGTLLKHKAEGDSIHWLIGTCIPEDHPVFKGKTQSRNDEIKKVETMYGFDSVHNLNIPTLMVDQHHVTDMVDRVSKVIEKVKPNILYLPYYQDIHSDHRALFEVIIACTKVFRYPYIQSIYMMEVLSETDFALNIQSTGFVPNTFVDITPYLEKKLEIMSVFESEIGDHPFPRSLEGMEALAKVRGIACGTKYAESFVLVKQRR